MDQSPAKVATYNAYGGSDIAAPSFNRPRYVRYASVHQPKEFGQLDLVLLDISGDIGAEYGTQTLFFAFSTRQEARIGIRRVPINRYTDQYITIAAQYADGGQLDIGPDGFIGTTRLFTTGQDFLREILLEIGYVLCGYWDKGYAEFDCFTQQEENTVVTGQIVNGVVLGFDSRFAQLLPPGDFVVTVTNSQWPSLPYHIQILVSPKDGLSGVADIEIGGEARMALQNLSGPAEIEIDGAGNLAQLKELGGPAIVEVDGSGTLNVQSP